MAQLPDLLTLFSFLAIICAAPVVYRAQTEYVRHLVVPLAIVSGVLFVVRVPTLLPAAPGVTALQVLLGLGLAWILAKLLLLQRFSAMHGSRVALHENELGRLLPFQEKDLEQLRQAILAGSSEQGSRVIQLVGRWGQGKSFVIERLELFLRCKARVENNNLGCAVVVINVWEQQSEPDLHLAIVEQILSHEKYWYPYGWLHYPLPLIVARVAKEWRLALSMGAAAKAEVKVPLVLPRPTGRRYLEQQVTRVRKSGTRTIVVLDEIDRAAPRVAQSAVTLTRRSLDMPGVVVVLSYVDQLMRYKAFNPLVSSLPDLDSTMCAVIFDKGPESATGGPAPASNGSRPGGALSERHDASLRNWEAWQKAAEARLPIDAGVATSDRPENNLDAIENADSRLSETLRLAFANANVGQRRKLQEMFSEKYLGTHPIQMRRLGPDDVASVVVLFDTLKDRVRDLLGVAELDDQLKSRLTTTIVAALATFERASRSLPEPPALRKLEGALFRRLSGVDLTDRPVGGFSPEFVAAVVLAAYDAAARDRL